MDLLPSGLAVANPNGLTNSCGGTPAAVAGSTSVGLSGGTLAAGGSCTFTLNVTGSTVGVKNNVSGAVTSVEGGIGGTAAASVTVIGPPGITKTFGTSSIPLNGVTSLTVTITNSNGSALTGIGFTDLLPGGLAVANPNGFTNSCGGTPAAVAGSTSVGLSGGTVTAGGSCAVVVNVTGTASGVQNNVTSSVASTEGGSGGTAFGQLDRAWPGRTSRGYSRRRRLRPTELRR